MSINLEIWNQQLVCFKLCCGAGILFSFFLPISQQINISGYLCFNIGDFLHFQMVLCDVLTLIYFQMVLCDVLTLIFRFLFLRQ